MAIAPSPTSRFQILERPLRHPGKCVVCGNAQVPVVDFGMTVPGYGVVYFCLEDLRDLARTIGMVPESEVSELREATEQSLFNYCFQRDLRLVTNEWYALVTSAIGSLSALSLDPGIHFSSENDESTGTEVPDDVTGAAAESPKSDPGNNDSTGQDSDAPVDEGSTSVPAGSDDEPEPGSFSF